MPAPPDSIMECRTLDGLSRYLVRADGAVIRDSAARRVAFNLLTSQIGRMAERLNDEGYRKVKLTDDDGRRREYFVHRLVALAFLPEPLPGQRYVLHGPDHTRTNCRWDNLRWGTHAANHEDKLERGTASSGGQRKLLPRDVRRIRESTLGAAKLAKKMGLSVSHVREVRNGRRWARHAGARRRTA